MTKEEKQLLLIDFCARLPYGVKVKVLHLQDDVIFTLCGISKDTYLVTKDNGSKFYIPNSIDVFPYLRPMSSMTEEEKKEYELLANHCIVTSIGFIHLEAAPLTNWLNAHHFDYHTDDEGKTMIEKGVALEAPEGMYN